MHPFYGHTHKHGSDHNHNMAMVMHTITNNHEHQHDHNYDNDGHYCNHGYKNKCFYKYGQKPITTINTKMVVVMVTNTCKNMNTQKWQWT